MNDYDLELTEDDLAAEGAAERARQAEEQESLWAAVQRDGSRS